MPELVLEYLKVILTAPVIFGAVAFVVIFKFGDDIKSLIGRIAKIRLGSGLEVSTLQSERLAKEENQNRDQPQPTGEAVDELPQELTPDERERVEAIIKSHSEVARWWEYQYLNFFLVRKTQVALDWLVTQNQSVAAQMYDSVFMPWVPSSDERNSMINALERHHLILFDNKTMTITVTPKGREYQQWRGPLPPVPGQES